MSELIQLQSSLDKIFRIALSGANWVNTEALKNLQKTNKVMGSISALSSTDTTAQVVAEYRRTGRLDTFRTKKYVCYGAATPMQDGWCVLGDNVLRRNLLDEAEQQIEFRRRLKCFEWLLGSYFAFSYSAFERHDEHTLKLAQSGWEILRDWLESQRKQIGKQIERDGLRQPDWFVALTEHKNLLTNKPCDRYGADMLRGVNSSIEEAKQELGIPQNSWVMQEAILSTMREAARLVEVSFKTKLDLLVKLVLDQTDSILIKRCAVAILASHYASYKSKPEHPALRDAAVSIIGNPWLKRTDWDAWVKKPDGQPDEEARQMINGWITRRLIRDFFELLSADGKALQRRIDYWLKYESQIEGLWFVLGPNAWGRDVYDPRYKAVRDRSDASQWLEMSNVTNKDNNAFVMRIGDKLVIEFGLTGHACFFYSAEPMPFVLGETISERRLKIHNQSGIGKKLTHQGSWEDSFDSIMRGDVRSWPRQSTSQLKMPSVRPESNNSKVVTSYPTATSRNNFDEAAFWSLIKKHSIPTKDDRSSGDPLWVKIEESRYPMIDQLLSAWGFKYKLGRGWWRE